MFMSYFIKLNDRVYKIKNRTTIGRGLPFEGLEDERDLRRAHCKIIKKNEQFYIKKINQKASTLVNGNEIEAGKFTLVGIKDKITLAGVELELLTSYEFDDYVNLVYFGPPMAKMSRLSFSKKYALSCLAVFIVACLVNSSFTITGLLTNILTSFVVGFGIALQLFLGGKYLGRNDEILVNEIILSEHGLTLHYKQKNMSINFKDIKHVYKNGKVISIHAHNECFCIYNMPNIEKIFKTILDRTPRKAQNSKPVSLMTIDTKTQYAIALAILALVASLYLYLGDLWYFKQILTLVLIITTLPFCIYHMLGYANSKNISIVKKTAIFLFLAVTSITYLEYIEIVPIKNTQASFYACIEGSSKDCKQVNFDYLSSHYGEESKELKQALSKICKVDSGYCEKHKESPFGKRTPASLDGE
jgi:hypothetical protein